MAKYSNYANNMRVLEAEADQWYDTIDLLKTLILIKQQNLSTHQGRLQSHGMLNQLGTSVFSEESRFPATRRYIRETDQPWLGLFTQLRSALLYSDREGETGGAAAGDARYRSSQDAARAITGAVDAMLMNVRQRFASYDRGAFESHFGITWSAFPGASTPNRASAVHFNINDSRVDSGLVSSPPAPGGQPSPPRLPDEEQQGN